MDADHTAGRDSADMERLAAGHDAALNDLMERHALPIFHYLCRMLGSEEDARDLAQETFARVYQHRARFRSGEPFGPWLYTIAGNLARNHHRWRARHPTASLDREDVVTERTLGEALPSSEPDPGALAQASERAAAVRAAVAGLPPDMREAVILCEWQELAVGEAAIVLRTTPKAVESRLYRARRLLRQRLKPWL